MEDKQPVAANTRLESRNDLIRRGGHLLRGEQPDQVGRHAGRRKPARRPEGIYAGDLVRRCCHECRIVWIQEKRIGVFFNPNRES